MGMPLRYNDRNLLRRKLRSFLTALGLLHPNSMEVHHANLEIQRRAEAAMLAEVADFCMADLQRAYGDDMAAIERVRVVLAWNIRTHRYEPAGRQRVYELT